MKITMGQLVDAFGRQLMNVQFLRGTSAEDLRPHTAGTVSFSKIVEAVNSIPEVAAAPEIETCEAIGTRPDGTSEIIGAIPLPPEMKAREIVRSYFSGSIDDDMSEASLALGAMEELINWLKEQGRLT